MFRMLLLLLKRLSKFRWYKLDFIGQLVLKDFKQLSSLSFANISLCQNDMSFHFSNFQVAAKKYLHLQNLPSYFSQLDSHQHITSKTSRKHYFLSKTSQTGKNWFDHIAPNMPSHQQLTPNLTKFYTILKSLTIQTQHND